MAGKKPGDYRELLRNGKWFRGLPAELETALLGAAELVPIKAGASIFARGDPPSGLYAVLDGAVRVSGTGESGKEALLTLVEPPAWFGEISVFDGLPRTHDAVAHGASLLLRVPQGALDALLERQPGYWRDLALLMAHKLRLVFGVMEEMAVLPIPARVARRLVAMADGYGEWHDRQRRVVSVKQEQLAQMLSTSRQTVNQVLKDLEVQGLVKLTYGEIELLDGAGLRRAAKLEE